MIGGSGSVSPSVFTEELSLLLIPLLPYAINVRELFRLMEGGSKTGEGSTFLRGRPRPLFCY